ncbi:hypothetical protein ACFL17_02700 [Pseudomonadota bacterium]
MSKDLLGVLVVVGLMSFTSDGFARDKGTQNIDKDCVSSDKDSEDKGRRKSRRSDDSDHSGTGVVAKVVSDDKRGSDECDENKRVGNNDDHDGKRETGSVKGRAAKKAGKAAATGIVVKKAKDAIKD